MSIKEQWKKLYKTVPNRLDSLKQVDGVLSVFNANIDAVLKVTPSLFSSWVEKEGISTESLLGDGQHSIDSKSDLLRGFLFCFSQGIAQEWLVTDEKLYQWMKKGVGYDKLQMGGQGGIIANVMSTCEIKKTAVHCASLPNMQSSLFVNNPNLFSANADGELTQVSTIAREEDTPLVHWILEFNKDDVITIGDTTIQCPKSNRFIATWDPLNFKLAIDSNFNTAINAMDTPVDYCLLAGYQMLTEPLADGTSALSRIQKSKEVVDNWREVHPSMYTHFEFASTQDAVVRKALFTEMGNWAESMGVNEQELIDILEILGLDELASECKSNLSSVPLFKGLLQLMKSCSLERVQLHMFGLYITVQRKNCTISPKDERQGMMLAATIAASKAGTGTIEKSENLLWGNSLSIGDVSQKELESLHNYLKSGDENTNILDSGLASVENFDVIAIPTLIVDKPITLVGMGDTISSLSLVGAGLSRN